MSDNIPENIKHELEKSDVEIIRLLEDLIEVLILKGVINYTDLPGAAMQKILMRQKLRDSLHEMSPINHENH